VERNRSKWLAKLFAAGNWRGEELIWFGG
jgi:hypothetical protein